jgi:adenylosuccinate synthase
MTALGQWTWVVRFNGGANAGHTIRVNTIEKDAEGNEGPVSKKYVVHHLPSAILHPNVRLVLGNGMVIDIPRLIEELDELIAQGINFDNRLFISSHAHVVLPKHLENDADNQKRLGSTGRGIGPAYADKIARTGIMVGDLYSMPESELAPLLGGKRAMTKWRKYIGRIEPYVSDTFFILATAYQNGEKILFEGAQGLLLDVDNGTYPYVTSSNVHPSYAPIGSGLSPQSLRKVLGVCKAFTSRVGTGPFPTEMDEADSKALRDHAGEYGSTTGRPRRLGWIDLPLLSRMGVQGGIQELALTKLDSLGIFNKIPVCIGYSGIEKTHKMTFTNYLEKVKPVYTTIDGWDDVNFDNIKTWNNLPISIRRFVDLIEDNTKIRVRYISTGPNRHQIVEL